MIYRQTQSFVDDTYDGVDIALCSFGDPGAAYGVCTGLYFIVCYLFTALFTPIDGLGRLVDRVNLAATYAVGTDIGIARYLQDVHLVRRIVKAHQPNAIR